MLSKVGHTEFVPAAAIVPFMIYQLAGFGTLHYVVSKPVNWVINLLLLGLIVGAVIGGGTLARHHWLHRVEALALRKLPVLTDGVLSEREIVAQAGLRPGLNTFAIDLPTVRARLLRHPRIASAEVHRELPDTIRLHVRERFPVAKVKAL